MDSTNKDRETIKTVSGACLFIVVFVILGTLIFNSCCHAGIRSTVKKIPLATIKLITNDRFLKWTATFAIISHARADAQYDALNFAQGRQTWGISYDKMHIYKNEARGWMLVYGIAKGMRIMKSILTNSEFNKKGSIIKVNWKPIKADLWEETKRFVIGDGLAAWEIWQRQYDYNRRGKLFDYTPAYNEHIIVIPIGQDNFITWFNYPTALKAIDIGVSGLSVYGLYSTR